MLVRFIEGGSAARRDQVCLRGSSMPRGDGPLWADGGFFRISLFLMRDKPGRAGQAVRFLVSAAFVACFSYSAPSWVQFLAMFLCIEVPARLLFKLPMGYSRCAWVFAPPLVSPVCLPLPGMLPA